MTKTNTLLEIAARCTLENVEEYKGYSDVDCKRYIFDTRVLFGDVTYIHVPMPFACEMAARSALYGRLVKTCE